MAKLVFFCFFSTAFGDIIKSPSKYFSFHWHALELTGSYDWVLYNFLNPFVWDNLSAGSGACLEGMIHTLIPGGSGPVGVLPGLCCWNIPLTNHRCLGVPRRALDISHILLIRPYVLAIQLPLIVTFQSPHHRGMQRGSLGSLNLHFRGVSEVTCWKQFSTCWS